MDALFVDKVPMQRLFFYEGPDVPPFPSLVHSLKSSLATALAAFRPLAGKLTHRASTGDVVVDCSSATVSPGVRFVEAEYAGSVHDMRHLAVGEEHHTEALMLLGPELDAGRLPAPVLAVQVDERNFGNCVTAVHREGRRARPVRRKRRARGRRRGHQGRRPGPGRGSPGLRAEHWLEGFVAVPKERLSRTGSSNRFMTYDDTDLGWGAPSRVELVSLFTRELVLLLGAVDGGVLVTVALDHAHMDRFAANFFLQVPGGLGR